MSHISGAARPIFFFRNFNEFELDRGRVQNLSQLQRIADNGNITHLHLHSFKNHFFSCSNKLETH